jgi:phosphoribosylformimino-5-aminoimidazole carboxamide ribotide isomerase
VDAILFTDIRRDGTGLGPSVESTMELQALVKCTVIASGGIGSIEHVLGLARAGARATVCGRALYDGSFTYEQAMSALRGVL